MFQTIFKPKLFSSVKFKQTWYLLWHILRECTTEQDVIDVEKESLYIRIELYWSGKAILPSMINIDKIEQMGYFPLHYAIFDNRLHMIRKLLVNEM